MCTDFEGEGGTAPNPALPYYSTVTDCRESNKNELNDAVGKPQSRHTVWSVSSVTKYGLNIASRQVNCLLFHTPLGKSTVTIVISIARVWERLMKWGYALTLNTWAVSYVISTDQKVWLKDLRSAYCNATYSDLCMKRKHFQTYLYLFADDGTDLWHRDKGGNCLLILHNIFRKGSVGRGFFSFFFLFSE